ncbi:peptidoglycan/LPS O-acetylase OafA/YrhL [Sporosarcina luteola]|nr:peptidoglycan/LPS O-acetylase OafA/YrhL [Sporosarcina luteola]
MKIRTRKIGAILIGVAILIVVGYSIFKIISGREVGFQEVIVIGTLLMMFFSALTWGTKEQKDGILQEEELGQRIIEKSSKISYFILLFFILAAVAADQFINHTVNIFLLAVLGLAIILLPFVEFVVAKKYQ